MKLKTILVLSLIIISCSESTLKKDISGVWQFTTDSTKWNQNVVLPGSMASNDLGEDVTVTTDWTGGIVDSSFFTSDQYAVYRRPGNVKVPFWLQPVKYYKGVAWYRKEINIPAGWQDRDLMLFLERCHWESRLWIDDEEIGMRNALGAPHRYDLTGRLTPGKHTLLLRVDNRVKNIDPGENSHSISDHTQGNWNGIVGDMYIDVRPAVNISAAVIYPDADAGQVKVCTKLMNRKSDSVDVQFALAVGKEKTSQKLKLQPGETEVELTLMMSEAPRLWDEFTPNIYTMRLTLTDNDSGTKDTRNERFGFRKLQVTDGKLTINGRQLFLRGTLDCAAFPKTGYPPTDKRAWLDIYETCKAHGLNHVRFHSWCPPEAAFDAADEMGMYLEVECSSWANQSTTIGDGGPLDRFIQQESERIVSEYGNHPSFCMMMYGNEPAGKHKDRFLADFVKYWKRTDSRRLYCSSAGWPNLPVSDFLSDPAPRIQAWGQGVNSIINAEAPNTDYDWGKYIGKFKQPMVSHEIGQWCVYPNFKEMKKYDGVMKPRNFEIFKETLDKNGMGHLADSFLLASGKLQVLCYKADIEAALRTKDFGGFQLLGLYDFPGQGTALVGVLDAFWEPKGYVTADEYRQFCNSTVPLVRLPRLIYTDRDTLCGTAEIVHFANKPLQVTKSTWRLLDDDGVAVASGELAHGMIPIGNCIRLGDIKAPLDKVKSPARLTLELNTGGYVNRWHVWVYPSHDEIDNDAHILMTDRLDDEAVSVLDRGGKVLLSIKKGTLAANRGGNVAIGFSSIFWNTAWTEGQAPHTLGILCDPSHPALAKFPTEYYSDYQWWDAMSHSGAIEYTKVASRAMPIVRVIDDWFTNRPLALLFEVKVGNGKLLVSGVDFWDDMDNRLAGRQLLRSIIDYMRGDRFNPVIKADVDSLRTLIQVQ